MKYSKELIVGLSLALAAVILVLGVRFLEDVPLFRGTYDLISTFEDAGGLTSGNSVRIHGVRVGAVDDVHLDVETGRVLVRFHVDRGIPIPEGSYTTLGGMSVLGTVHMNVELGPPTAERVPEGGLIPSEPEVGLLDAITRGGPQLLENVESILLTANQTLEEAEVLFRDASVDTRQALQSFRQATVTLDDMLRREQAGVSRIVTNVEGFTSSMGRLAEESADTMSHAVRTLSRSMARLERSLESLEASAATFDAILLRINDGDGTMGRLINDPALFVRLDSTLNTLHLLLEDVRSDPGKFLRHMSMIRVF